MAHPNVAPARAGWSALTTLGGTLRGILGPTLLIKTALGIVGGTGALVAASIAVPRRQ